MTGAMAQTKLNIVLCGFMGCGKSTVGKKLSQMTQMEFVDMDGYIEKRAGMKIPDIFEKHGEGFFRDLEHEAAVELSQRGGYVVATGGGALTFQRNVDAFKEGGVIVLLDTPLRVLQLRLKNDRNRPLLQRPDRFRFIRELRQKRMPLYRRAADVVIPTKGSPNAVCRQVLQALEEKNLTNS